MQAKTNNDFLKARIIAVKPLLKALKGWRSQVFERFPEDFNGPRANNKLDRIMCLYVAHEGVTIFLESLVGITVETEVSEVQEKLSA